MLQERSTCFRIGTFSNTSVLEATKVPNMDVYILSHLKMRIGTFNILAEFGALQSGTYVKYNLS